LTGCTPEGSRSLCVFCVYGGGLAGACVACGCSPVGAVRGLRVRVAAPPHPRAHTCGPTHPPTHPGGARQGGTSREEESSLIIRSSECFISFCSWHHCHLVVDGSSDISSAWSLDSLAVGLSVAVVAGAPAPPSAVQPAALGHHHPRHRHLPGPTRQRRPTPALPHTGRGGGRGEDNDGHHDDDYGDEALRDKGPCEYGYCHRESPSPPTAAAPGSQTTRPLYPITTPLIPPPMRSSPCPFRSRSWCHCARGRGRTRRFTLWAC
jgi:hypothetical protein